MRSIARVLVIGVLCVVVGASCGGGREPEVGSQTEEIISDAVHSFGNPGFYFLPPMVPNPTLIGTFAPGLQPVVRIDEYRAPSVKPVN